MSGWIEFLGRTHPMVLHLPIGFFAALCVIEVVAHKSPSREGATRWLVRLTALSTLVAVGSGLLHAKGDDFSGERLELHRNLGIALGCVALIALGFHERLAAASASGSRTSYRVLLFVALCLLIPTGHYGAELTHGPGFLSAPLARDADAGAPPAQAPQPSTFAQRIRPILDAKCVPCHGDAKQKGGLSLATQERMLAGGRRGPALTREDPTASPMLARIQLELDHDKHMPPLEREQLEPAELAALRAWFAAGAPFEGVIEGLADASEVPSAETTSNESVTKEALVPPAAPAALASLRDALAHVQPIAAGSNLLWADFAATAKSLDDATAHGLLLPLAAQLAEISMARCAIGPKTHEALAACGQLRRLDLRATALDDAGLRVLARLPRLAELVLAQNSLSDASVDTLIAMPALKRVLLWRSGLSREGVARLREARPELSIDDGEAHESQALEAETAVVFTRADAATTAPVANSAPLVPINTKCPVSGAPVKPEFSIVHEGRVIGFCCPECPRSFWADPQKFQDRLQ